MEVFALSGLINGIFAMGFGALIIFKDRRNRLNQLFFLMTLAIALWAFGYWQWLSSTEGVPALFWVKVLSIGSIFIPVFYFHWITFFLDIYKQKRISVLLILSYLAAFCLLLLSSSPLFIKDVRPMLFFSYWPEPGLLYTIYLLLIYMGLVVYSLFLLHRSYLSSSGERRGQILYVIVGAIIGFGGGLTNFFLWYDIPIAPYGNFLVAFFPFFLGYAILKHHLFNVKVIATELMTFVIWTAIFVEMLEADTFKERVFEIGLLVFVVFFGILLIRSVLRLEETNVRLKQLDKLKSEFLSFASHQIKAPMTVIKGYASLISEGSYGPIPEKAKEGSAHIKEVADRLIGLVDDFLNLRRIEEGRMEYQFGKTNIVDLVDSVANDFMILAQNKKLDLTFKGPGHEIIVKADREKLRQVIQNLIENAIKYTDKGFVRVELKEKKDSVLIAVSDTGLGISKKLLPNLFQQFSRDPATAGKIEGTGLGLYIAREIIRAHNGKIWAESNGEDKGATFYVELAKKVDLPEGEHVDIALKL